jgi:hypothetical protein
MPHLYEGKAAPSFGEYWIVAEAGGDEFGDGLVPVDPGLSRVIPVAGEIEVAGRNTFRHAPSIELAPTHDIAGKFDAMAPHAHRRPIPKTHFGPFSRMHEDSYGAAFPEPYLARDRYVIVGCED